ncbi:antigen WC1.1 [Chelmon rostratus]|uniref:antigen WC1.1 n=1 Tax=Chelmon rostratus TaxID=109905 RepID=UPI001BEAED5F|nr:antigen WC1.1 [Chelmon rostratus]
MMWFLLLLCTARIEPVFSQGSGNRLILEGGGNPCRGHVKIYHDGAWGYVGDKYWDSNLEKVVCKSIHCGKPVLTMTCLRRPGTTVWLNELRCNGNENHLWDCDHPGWNVSSYPSDTLKHIECSNEIKISLDGFRCAGAVQYSIVGQNHSGYFCDNNWGQMEADFLCKTLGCGTTAIPQRDWVVWKGSKSSKNMMIHCTDIKNLDNLWQCVTQESESCSNPASVICTDYERLQLTGKGGNVCEGQLQKETNGKWTSVKTIKETQVSRDEMCQQMYCGSSENHSQDDSDTQLNCTDNVTVDLMDGTKTNSCYGEVHVTVNNVSHRVCGFNWTDNDAKVVCREKNCGRMVSTFPKPNTQDGIMDNVKCSGRESSLWHCRATRDKEPFSCSSTAYVVCADSMDVRLMDGPGTCAGRLEIQYEGQWRRVAKDGWTADNSDAVCRQQGCGNSRKSASADKFSPGSGDFFNKAVTCKKNALHISECTIGDSITVPSETAEITCEEHKVVFLEGGNSPCSGKVGIEHGSKTYWLSGSNKTWNHETANTVCRQTLCGEPSDFTSIPSSGMMKDVWNESYTCSPKTKSLFKCEKATLPSDYNAKIATVKCSGNIQVGLTDRCWGNVNVCMGEKCGGVCKDTWTEQKSAMLCKNLGCGNAIPGVVISPEETGVIFKSLHLRQSATNLHQSSFIEYDETDVACNRNPAHVVCSGSVKTRINASRYKCFGHVEAYLGGQWLPVCSSALKDSETRNTICSEMGCGQTGEMVDDFGPKSTRDHVISQMQCSTDGKRSLAACSIISTAATCALGVLRCSGWSKMELKFNKACSGAVFVHSAGNRNSISIQGWTETVGNRLCRDLGCGDLKSHETKEATADSGESRHFNCSSVDNPQNIWDCEKQILLWQQQQQLFIECDDEPSVSLSETCGGEVKMNGFRLCSTGWKEAYSHLVCQEQNCSNALFTSRTKSKPDEDYLHVRCEDYHHKLGQCDTFKGRCDDSVVSVYCVGNVKFNTTEKCGGLIEVNYRNKWEKVCTRSVSPQRLEELCQKLNCGGYSGKITNRKQRAKVETTLDCSAGLNHIQQCVRPESCVLDQPEGIYCINYVEPEPEPSTTRIVPIVLGVGFLLVLVILIVVFVRVCIVKKAKRPTNVSSRMISGKEVEFESGSFEDVTSNAEEMKDFHHSKAQVFTESEAQSASSFPYDDIDEAAEARPLTSQAASGDNDFHEGVLDQSSDGATYEVEDPQEHYDDIEAGPEITETEAEVHEGPQTTLESVAVAPPGLVLGDEDYLVPGQDG